MANDPYFSVSDIYSHLMSSVDYSFWARYIEEIHSTLRCKKDFVLEIGSGNCTLASFLKDYFKNLIASDISLRMLKKSTDKNIYRICCDMNLLPFRNKFDFIFSTFDTINYLEDETQFELFLSRLGENITKEGLFVFDASLENNSLKHLKKLNRKGEYNGVKYIQKSTYDKIKRIHKNEFKFFLNDGTVVKEIHKQKIYDFYYYFEVLDKCGFYVVECFNDFNFKDANPNSERVQFVVKKRK